jgi:uncharacterized membrane protein
VTTSSYAVIAGAPVALLGLIFWAAMTVLCLPMAWQGNSRFLVPLRLGGAAVGMLTVLYLVWVELFRLNAICLWCTGAHILTFILFVVVLLASPATDVSDG